MPAGSGRLGTTPRGARRGRGRRPAAALALVGLALTGAHALIAREAPAPGELTGTVRTAGGSPAGDVFVVARRVDRPFSVAVLTDSGGRYVVGPLESGRYAVEVRRTGEAPLAADTLEVGDGGRQFDVVLRAPAGAVRESASADWLATLPDGEEKRRFVLDCTGCHQFDARVAMPGGAARTKAGWTEAVERMLRYGGATSPFPVISHERRAGPTATWLAQHLSGASVANSSTSSRTMAARASVGRAVVTEYDIPAPKDLPHDVAVDTAGRVIVTGMFTDRMYVLDPVCGEFSVVAIPVEHANPRAVELDADGNWWVVLGAAHKLARYAPATGAWTTFDVGVYPHSLAVGRGGDVWFNGHFTRAPELIGKVGSGGAVATYPVPAHPTLATKPGGPIPYEIRIGRDGRVWGSELHGNRLFSFTPATGSFQVYRMPVSYSGPRRFDVDARGVVWIPAYAGNALVRLDPKTARFERFELPIRDAVPYVARVDARTGLVWVGTSAADAVLSFGPAQRRFTAYPLPSRGALVRHLAVDTARGVVWAAYGASPGIPARIARITPR